MKGIPRSTTRSALAGLAVAVLAGGASAQALRAGSAAPAFSLTNSEGSILYLKDLQANGPFFLYFINPEDPTNALAVTYIDRIAGAYAPAKAKWYGVIAARQDRAQAWQSEINPPYQLYLDPDLTTVRTLHIQSSPTVMLIDASGHIVKEWDGLSATALKDLNRTVARINHAKAQTIDLTNAPATTRFGAQYGNTTAGGARGR